MDKYLQNSMHVLLVQINKQMLRRAGTLPSFIQETSGRAGLVFEFHSFSSFLPFSNSSLVFYLNFILILVSRAEHTKESFALLFSNEKSKLQ